MRPARGGQTVNSPLRTRKIFSSGYILQEKIHFAAFSAPFDPGRGCRARPSGALAFRRRRRPLLFCTGAMPIEQGGRHMTFHANGAARPLWASGWCWRARWPFFCSAWGLGVRPFLLAAWAAAVYGGFVPRLASAKTVCGQAPCFSALGHAFSLCAPVPTPLCHRLPHSGDAALPPYGRVRADVLKLWRLPDSSRL